MEIQEIKNLTIIALASDDFLVETLVLKGGNAISLLESDKRENLSRASYDLDFSIKDDFDTELKVISDKIRYQLEQTFAEKEHVVFDYSFIPQPGKALESVKDFWGGYLVEFKIVSLDLYKKYSENIQELRKNAISILPNNSPKVQIEISKYEYVDGKIEFDLEGYMIYLYSPKMIVYEKLRAICQQHPEYCEIVPSHKPRARARDFYDIYVICDLHAILPISEIDKDVIKAIFKAKRVPLDFISLIPINAEIHRSDWQSVIDTVSAKEDIEDFDFYLKFIVDNFGSLATL